MTQSLTSIAAAMGETTELLRSVVRSAGPTFFVLFALVVGFTLVILAFVLWGFLG